MVMTYFSSVFLIKYIDSQYLAGARGIEPRSRVLETLILAVVLCPYNISLFMICYKPAFVIVNTFKSDENLLYIE